MPSSYNYITKCAPYQVIINSYSATCYCIFVQVNFYLFFNNYLKLTSMRFLTTTIIYRPDLSKYYILPNYILLQNSKKTML